MRYDDRPETAAETSPRRDGADTRDVSAARIGQTICFLVVGLWIAGPGAPRAHADGATESLKPVQETRRSVVFDVDELEPTEVVNARVRLRPYEPRLRRWLERQDAPRRKALRKARRRLERGLRPARVRAAASRDARLKLDKPVFARGGRLRVKLRTADQEAGAGVCSFDAATMTATGCTPRIDDTGSTGDAASIWGKIDCEDTSRHQLAAGGDPHVAASGYAQSSDAFRRLTVFDGDDVWGERCELGLNSHETGPTAIFREGERWITFASLRLPDSYPQTDTWQVVMQMKQTQPSANGGGTPVIAMNARNGEWRLLQSNSPEASSDSHVVWAAPNQIGTWTRFAFDVTYSQDHTRGLIRVYVDLNGDGDAVDAGEQSSPIQSYTLKRETVGGSAADGIAPGESIPSHLRLGIYHDTAVNCPAGCSIDVDNVQVVRAG
jgi:hypothetical protein